MYHKNQNNKNMNTFNFSLSCKVDNKCTNSFYKSLSTLVSFIISQRSDTIPLPVRCQLMWDLNVLLKKISKSKKPLHFSKSHIYKYTLYVISYDTKSILVDVSNF